MQGLHLLCHVRIAHSILRVFLLVFDVQELPFHSRLELHAFVAEKFARVQTFPPGFKQSIFVGTGDGSSVRAIVSDGGASGRCCFLLGGGPFDSVRLQLFLRFFHLLVARLDAFELLSQRLLAIRQQHRDHQFQVSQFHRSLLVGIDGSGRPKTIQCDLARSNVERVLFKGLHSDSDLVHRGCLIHRGPLFAPRGKPKGLDGEVAHIVPAAVVYGQRNRFHGGHWWRCVPHLIVDGCNGL